MIKLLTIATHLADSLHYLRGVRFDITGVADSTDYQKALQLGQKAYEALLAVIDEMADDGSHKQEVATQWHDARTNPPQPDKHERQGILRTKPFVCIVRYKSSGLYMATEQTYDFDDDRWFGVGDVLEVLYWQEYPALLEAKI